MLMKLCWPASAKTATFPWTKNIFCSALYQVSNPSLTKLKINKLPFLTYHVSTSFRFKRSSSSQIQLLKNLLSSIWFVLKPADLHYFVRLVEDSLRPTCCHVWFISHYKAGRAITKSILTSIIKLHKTERFLSKISAQLVNTGTIFWKNKYINWFNFSIRLFIIHQCEETYCIQRQNTKLITDLQASYSFHSWSWCPPGQMHIFRPGSSRPEVWGCGWINCQHL